LQILFTSPQESAAAAKLANWNKEIVYEGKPLTMLKVYWHQFSGPKELQQVAKDEGAEEQVDLDEEEAEDAEERRFALKKGLAKKPGPAEAKGRKNIFERISVKAADVEEEEPAAEDEEEAEEEQELEQDAFGAAAADEAPHSDYEYVVVEKEFSDDDTPAEEDEPPAEQKESVLRTSQKISLLKEKMALLSREIAERQARGSPSAPQQQVSAPTKPPSPPRSILGPPPAQIAEPKPVPVQQPPAAAEAEGDGEDEGDYDEEEPQEERAPRRLRALDLDGERFWSLTPAMQETLDPVYEDTLRRAIVAVPMPDGAVEGTCTTMCPAKELALRTEFKDLIYFEKVRILSNSVSLLPPSPSLSLIRSDMISSLKQLVPMNHAQALTSPSRSTSAPTQTSSSLPRFVSSSLLLHFILFFMAIFLLLGHSHIGHSGAHHGSFDERCRQQY